MSDQSRIQSALGSRDPEIRDAFHRLYAPFNNSDATDVPSDGQLAAAARDLRDAYGELAAAVARAGRHVTGAGKLAAGLAEYSDAYDKLNRGIRSKSQTTRDNAFDDMSDLLDSADHKVSSAIRTLNL
ncbi:MAG TPA: hypothetical protein VGI67_17035 [Thermoleophilaceae bacterium]|jgi:hypothetical protein